MFSLRSFLFRLLAIFNVSRCAVPSCYVSSFIFEWSSADTETSETRRRASAIELRIHGASPQEIASFFQKGSVLDLPGERVNWAPYLARAIAPE